MTDRTKQLVADANLKQTLALGTADATVSTTGWDLYTFGSRDAFLSDCELEVQAPALTTTELPDADTCTYSVEADNDVAFGSPTVLHPSLITQTGAGGAGAAAQTKRFRLPSDVAERYIRVKAVLAGGTGDCSGKSLVAALLF